MHSPNHPVQSLVLTLGLVLTGLTLACTGQHAPLGMAKGDTLKVGITPNYPPIAFRDDDGLRGIEVDLARAASSEMGRRVDWVEMEWKSLIPSLESGEIDVIMSGMSITAARRERVLFTTPYMGTGQLALIRRAAVTRFGLPSALRRPGARIGFVRETTGQQFARQELTQAESYAFDDVDEGIRSLRSEHIDFFIHDAPTIWRVALDPDERELMGLFQPLTEEHLAWAVALGNTALKRELDGILDGWRANNQLDPLLNRWIPVRVRVGK